MKYFCPVKLESLVQSSSCNARMKFASQVYKLAEYQLTFAFPSEYFQVLKMTIMTTCTNKTRPKGEKMTINELSNNLKEIPDSVYWKCLFNWWQDFESKKSKFEQCNFLGTSLRTAEDAKF